MSHPLDGQPAPAAPLWYCFDHVLLVRCGCGRSAELDLGRLSLPGMTRLWQIAERLRCLKCGERPRVVGAKRLR